MLTSNNTAVSITTIGELPAALYSAAARLAKAEGSAQYGHPELLASFNLCTLM
jgi:hypothetical protein